MPKHVPDTTKLIPNMSKKCQKNIMDFVTLGLWDLGTLGLWDPVTVWDPGTLGNVKERYSRNLGEC